MRTILRRAACLLAAAAAVGLTRPAAAQSPFPLSPTPAPVADANGNLPPLPRVVPPDRAAPGTIKSRPGRSLGRSTGVHDAHRRANGRDRANGACEAEGRSVYSTNAAGRLVGVVRDARTSGRGLDSVGPADGPRCAAGGDRQIDGGRATRRR